MKPMRGYYSLIQYCPNLSRMEAVNVGVVLFCPEAGFIEARTTAGNDKPCRMFRRENVNLDNLNAAKKAIEERFKTDRQAFKEVGDLERFANTRANELLLTAPRPVKVFEPERELDGLFKELVGGRSRSDPKLPVHPELDKLFRSLSTQKRADLDYEVQIPVIGRILKVPYVYRNGIRNLVKPQVFPIDERRATDSGMRLALEGNLLKRHTANSDEASKLIVIVSFEGKEETKRIRNRLTTLFSEFEVESVGRDAIPAFLKKVEKEAHT